MDTPSAVSQVTDHDILIELRTTVNQMQANLNAVTTDHELRLRGLEKSDEKRSGAETTIKWLWGVVATIGAAVIAQFLLTGR